LSKNIKIAVTANASGKLTKANITTNSQCITISRLLRIHEIEQIGEISNCMIRLGFA
jgi:hypothetical protein